MKRVARILVTTLVIAGGFLARAEATPIISISPVTQNTTIGNNVSIDINVSNLGPTDQIGGVSFLLSFTSSIISGLSYVLDPTAKMGFAIDPLSNDFSLGFNGGAGSPLDIFFLADVTMNQGALAALQGTGFRLATITFQAIANGTSPLSLTLGTLSNWNGASTLATGLTANGSICVGPNCGGGQPPVVPEPTTMILLGTGISAMVARRRLMGKPRA